MTSDRGLLGNSMSVFFKPKLNFCPVKSLEISDKCLFLFCVFLVFVSLFCLVWGWFVCFFLLFCFYIVVFCFVSLCNWFCLLSSTHGWLLFLESQHVSVHGMLVTVVSIWRETGAPGDILTKWGTVHLLSLEQNLQWYLSTAVTDVTLSP